MRRKAQSGRGLTELETEKLHLLDCHVLKNQMRLKEIGGEGSWKNMLVIIRTRWETQMLKAKRKEMVRFMNVDSFPVVTSLTIDCIALLYVISARPGVQQHFIEACLNNGKGAKADTISGQLDSSDILFSCPGGLLLLLSKSNSFKTNLKFK